MSAVGGMIVPYNSKIKTTIKQNMHTEMARTANSPTVLSVVQIKTFEIINILHSVTHEYTRALHRLI